MGGLTALAVVVVAYTLVASRLDRWWITGPMVFVAAGVILGPGGLDVLPLSLTNETVLTITELTLALLLFSDASTVRLRDVEGDAGLPQRLLFVGLPLTIAAGALLAYLSASEVGWAAAALIATILAPTDAALGLAVVTNKAIPVRIRRALNVESGLNDGIATPFVTLFIAVVAAEEGLSDTAWGLEALKQIGAGDRRRGRGRLPRREAVGLRQRTRMDLRGFRADRHPRPGVARLPGICHGRRERIHRSVRRWHLVRGRHQRALAEPVQFTETLGLSGSFVVWMLFGALFVGELLTGDLAAQPVIYALLSLTVIRMVPVAIALIGTQLRPATVAFMGWFGPRGLASVVFMLLALEEIERGNGGAMLLETVTWTILLSVVLHGISASPLAARYGASIAKAGKIPEKAPAGEPRIRVRDLAGRHSLEEQQARVTT